MYSNIKIFKGEENVFIWSIFIVLVGTAIEELSIEEDDRRTNEFDDIKYIYIDDPITSLDENHVFELAIDLRQLIVESGEKTPLKFVVSTHHALFYTVLYNELKNNRKHRKFYKFERNGQKYTLEKQEIVHLDIT